MSILTLNAFVSLDGVMQAPGAPDEDKSGSFTQGGWLVPYADEDMGRIVVDSFSRADAFLLGRTTYQIFAGHWPRVTDPADPVATALNRLPKHVASTTLEKVDWNNSSVIRGDLAGAVRRLKAQYPRELQVHGSIGLVQTLLAEELLDELRLFHFPVVLGTGKPLFGRGAPPAAFKLVESSTTSTGMVYARYQRAGKPTYGSFALDG
jgi:dihydrofolate reductase